MVMAYGVSLHFITYALFHYFVYYESFLLIFYAKVHIANIVKQDQASMVLGALYLYKVYCAV